MTDAPTEWWLVRHAPHAVSMRVLREHQWRRAPSSVDFDERAGVLTAGDQAIQIGAEFADRPVACVQLVLSQHRFQRPKDCQ